MFIKCSSCLKVRLVMSYGLRHMRFLFESYLFILPVLLFSPLRCLLFTPCSEQVKLGSYAELIISYTHYLEQCCYYLIIYVLYMVSQVVLSRGYMKFPSLPFKKLGIYWKVLKCSYMIKVPS